MNYIKTVYQFIIDFVAVNVISIFLGVVIGGILGVSFHLNDKDLFNDIHIINGIVWLSLIFGFLYLEVKQRPIYHKIAILLLASCAPIILDYKEWSDAILYLVLYLTPMPVAMLIYKIFSKNKTLR